MLCNGLFHDARDLLLEQVFMRSPTSSLLKGKRMMGGSRNAFDIDIVYRLVSESMCRADVIR